MLFAPESGFRYPQVRCCQKSILLAAESMIFAAESTLSVSESALFAHKNAFSVSESALLVISLDFH